MDYICDTFMVLFVIVIEWKSATRTVLQKETHTGMEGHEERSFLGALGLSDAKNFTLKSLKISSSHVSLCDLLRLCSDLSYIDIL